jgi:hypothetical protein
MRESIALLDDIIIRAIGKKFLFAGEAMVAHVHCPVIRVATKEELHVFT